MQNLKPVEALTSASRWNGRYLVDFENGAPVGYTAVPYDTRVVNPNSKTQVLSLLRYAVSDELMAEVLETLYGREVCTLSA